MKELKKDDILQAVDIEREKVEVPEWNGVVYIGLMSAKERYQYEQYSLRQEQDENGYPNIDVYHFTMRLLAATLSDKEGNILFSKDDIEELASKSTDVLTRLFDIAFKINFLCDEGIEEAAKN